ncbi:MAG: L-serine ammonia-lyase, iron-sulfur-dependent, subunit alpha, partial [Betaproteobacteria bacterium]|nr:L-serine ammonia-lyase, iron-sulfur-dependent, subunit alpha [Betaproteobacteria bacterium]
MAISVFDIYKVGVGPSSSHTFGPMVAAQRFLKELDAERLFDKTARAQIELYASMSLTGKGHFTDLASMLGLEGNEPASLDSAQIPAKQKRIETEKTLNLGGRKMVPFDPERDIKWYGDKSFPTHPNGIAFVALDASGAELKRALYFSIGGGFVICERESLNPKDSVGDVKKPFPYTTGAQLAELCKREGKSIAQLVFRNELTWRTAPEIKRQLLEIAGVMEKSVEIGLAAEGEIPGLGLKRHAKEIWDKVKAVPWGAQLFELQDHVNAYALAVMEVNATLGQVVTAPTMGAAGIVPAVLQAYKKFGQDVTDDTICDFLL